MFSSSGVSLCVPPFAEHAQVLETHLVSILNLLHQKSPNLRIDTEE